MANEDQGRNHASKNICRRLRVHRLRRPPHFTRYAVTLVGRPTRFSIERARQELGWSPRVPAAEGLRQTLDWYYGRDDVGAGVSSTARTGGP